VPLCAAAALAVVSQTPSPPLAATNWKIDPARTHIALAIDAVDFARTEGRFAALRGAHFGRLHRCWRRSRRPVQVGADLPGILDGEIDP
jgi:hypothetical protein